MNTREKLLNLKNTVLREKVVQVDTPEGPFDVLIICPTVGQRNRWIAANASGPTMVLNAVLDCSADPVTRQPLFTEADRDLLLEQAVNSWVDQLGKQIMDLMNEVESTAKKDSTAT